MFKSGDQVVCVDCAGTSLLEKGRVYKVKKFEDYYLQLEETSDWWWSESRFQLLKMEPDPYDAAVKRLEAVVARGEALVARMEAGLAAPKSGQSFKGVFTVD